MQNFRRTAASFRNNAVTFFTISSLSLLLACNPPKRETTIASRLPSHEMTLPIRFFVETKKPGEGERIGLFYAHYAPDTSRVDTLNIYPGSTYDSPPTTVLTQGKSAIGEQPGWYRGKASAIIHNVATVFVAGLSAFFLFQNLFQKNIFEPLARFVRRSKKPNSKPA